MRTFSKRPIDPKFNQLSVGTGRRYQRATPLEIANFARPSRLAALERSKFSPAGSTHPQMNRVALIVLIAASAQAAPLISSEFGMDLPVSGPAYDAQTSVALCTGTANTLAVWVDKRDGASALYGARIKPDGSNLDPASLKLTRGFDPVLAFDGTNYLLVYARAVIGAYDQVVAQRISAAGVVIDPVPIALLSEPSEHQRRPLVAFDGTDFLIAWSSIGPKAVRLSKAGVVLDPAGIAITAFTGNAYSLGFNGMDFVLAGDQKLVRISPQGVVKDPAGIVHHGAAGALACDSSNCLLAWGTYGGVFGVRVAQSGTMLDAMPVKLASATTISATALSASVTFGGGNFAVSFLETSSLNSLMRLRAVRVTPALAAVGAVVDVTETTSTTINDKLAAPDIVSDGTNFLIAWDAFKQFQENRGDVFAARLSATAGLLDVTPKLIGVGASTQFAPVISSDGVNALVVWEDLRADSREDIYAARVSPSGAILDPTGIAIASSVEIERQPTVAFDGTNFMIIYSTWSSGIFGQRLSKSGALVGAAFQIVDPYTTSKNNPVVAFDGTNFQVAYEYAAFSNDIHLKRISPSGTVLDSAPIIIASGAVAQLSPAIACDGTNCLVVWDENGTKGRRMSPAGVALDATPINIGTGGYPKVVFDGTHYVVSGSSSGVSAARVSPAGVVLDVPAKTISATGYMHAMAWDGQHSFVSWLKYDSVLGVDIYGTWLDSTLAPLDPQPTKITPMPVGRMQSTALGNLGGKKMVLAYTLFDPGTQFNAWRVRSRLVSRDSVGGACTSAAQCASGFCVDGVCCESACGGGSATDCQACSAAAGSVADGLCGPARATTVCRASVGPCDLPEQCNGVATTCPANAPAANGTPCEDGNLCTKDSCQNGACIAGPALVCPAASVCHLAGSCVPATGQCSAESAVADESPCDDGDACTVNVCRVGQCVVASQCTADAGAPDAGMDIAMDAGAEDVVQKATGCGCEHSYGITAWGMVALLLRPLSAMGRRTLRRSNETRKARRFEGRCTR
jgi:hypothetical protein